MSTTQVVNSGIVGSAGRVSASRSSGASASGAMDFVDPLTGIFAPAARDQARGSDDEESFETPRRRRRSTPNQDHVISFGGVLVSREVGATMMKEQASLAMRAATAPTGSEAERSVAIYEFNQSLMGVAQAPAN